MATSVLGGLFGAPPVQDPEDLARREEAMRIAQMTPEQRAAYAMQRGGQMAGRGLAQAVGAAAGLETRTPTEQHQAAIARVKEKVKAAGIDPDDPETFDRFYRQVIQTLQQEGMAAAALEVGKEYQAQKIARAEQTRKTTRDVAADERSQERNAIALAKLGAGGPKVVQLMNQYDAETDPARRDTLKRAIDNLLAGKGVKAVPAGDRVELVDAQTGAPVRTIAVGMTPGAEEKKAKGENKMSQAFDSARQTLQSNYNAAVELYNHVGLSGIAGGLRGPILNDPDAKGHTVAKVSLGADARSAFDLFQRIRATSFISAFAEIKTQAQTTTGGSGLGALSDAEGRKLETAKAALGLNQEVDSLRRQLQGYIKDMENSAALFDQYKPEGATAGPLQTKALAVPTKRSASPAPAAPAAAPVAAGGGETWTRVNGKMTRSK